VTVAAVRCNELAVTQGSITLRLRGVWSADLVVDTEDASKVEGDVTIDIADGTLQLVGTARRAGVYQKRALVRVTGGKGALRKELEAKAYRELSAKVIVSEILDDAGESLSGDADSGALGKQLKFWNRFAGPAGQRLQDVANELGVNWRVLADGKVWLGSEAWADSKVKNFHLLSDNPATRSIMFGCDAPVALPGTTLDGRKLEWVEHRISPKSIVTEALYADDE
jgi:hypothetical protein